MRETLDAFLTWYGSVGWLLFCILSLPIGHWIGAQARKGHKIRSGVITFLWIGFFLSLMGLHIWLRW